MSRRTVAALTLALIVLVVTAGWVVRRWSDRRWATQQALPEIRRLIEQEQFVKAYELATEAGRYIANDSELAALTTRASRRIDIDSAPQGALVSYAAYAAEPSWKPIGTTPIRNASVPQGVLRWRVEKDGRTTAEDAISSASINVQLPPLEGAPDGMVRVSGPRSPGVTYVNGETQPTVAFDDFWIDRDEVTNRQYAAFVSAGGYRRPEFWRFPFREADSGLVPWKEAMTRFRDRTGRPGPATWVLGRFQQGHDDYPVTGISWYEAAAFAVYAGKSLPTLFHWDYVAAHADLISDVIPLANFSGNGALPVGRAQALHRFGTRNLAGNVKEWVFNERSQGKRYILGGAWDEPAYMSTWADARPAWDRKDNFGFRCVRYTHDIPASDPLNRAIPRPERDYARQKPVGDELFAAYTRVFSVRSNPD